MKNTKIVLVAIVCAIVGVICGYRYANLTARCEGQIDDNHYIITYGLNDQHIYTGDFE